MTSFDYATKKKTILPLSFGMISKRRNEESLSQIPVNNLILIIEKCSTISPIFALYSYNWDFFDMTNC